MKKIYLLVVFCCLSFAGFSQSKWYGNVNNGNVNDTMTWGNTPFSSADHPNDFTNPLDTYIAIVPLIMPIGTWDVNGTVIIDSVSGFERILKQASGASIINIGGALILRKKSKITTARPISGSFRINLFHDLIVRDSAFIASQGTLFSDIVSNTYIDLHFADTTATLTTPRVIRWSSVWDTFRNKFTSYTFDPRSVRKLEGNLLLPTYANRTTMLQGKLICGTDTMTSYNTDSFTIADSAFIYTGHASGLDGTIKEVTVRDFSKGANYIYNGIAAQVTGLTLPDSIYHTNGVAGRSGTVWIDNLAGVTLSQPTYLTGGSYLNLVKGVFNIGTNFTIGNSIHGSQIWINVDTGNFSTNPVYRDDACQVTVEYKSLGPNAPAVTTGYELQPVLPTKALTDVRVTKPGAIISLGSSPTVNGTVYLQFGKLDASTSNENITINEYTSGTGGGFANSAGADAFIPRGGTVSLLGPTYRTNVGGTTSTTFYNLTVNDTAGARFFTTDTVLGTLTLTKGKVYIANNDLYLGLDATAVAPGTFSDTNMIVADGTGHVIKKLKLDLLNYLLPVGDSVDYSPLSLTVLASAWGPAANVSVNLNDIKHPNNANTNHYLNRYWHITMNDMTAPNYVATGTYVTGDVTGLEANMAAGMYNSALPWLKYGAANVTLHTVTTGTVTDTITDVTGIMAAPPSITAPAGVRICMPAGAAPLTATAPLGDAVHVYTWEPAAGLSTTTGLITIATPSVTTTYSVTITDGNGFKTTSTVTVTVDATPTLSSPFAFTNSPVCEHSQITLTAFFPASVATFSWTGPVAISTGATTADATVDDAPLTAAGVYTVTLTNGTDSGCIAHYFTDPVVVNAIPDTVEIATDGDDSVYCNSTDITASNVPGDGTIYFQGTTSGGIDETYTATTQTILTSGTYYFRARNTLGCWGPQASVTLTINPLPAQYYTYATGYPLPGAYCAGDTGVHIGLDNSALGIRYQLHFAVLTTDVPAPVGAPIDGIGDTIDFGLHTNEGYYSIVATDTITGCKNDMLVVPQVVINTPPTAWNVTGGQGYCIDDPYGRPVGLNGQVPGIDYQLYYRDTITGSLFAPLGGPYSGLSSSSFDFGYFTAWGSYMVIATNPTTGCVNNMVDTVDIWVDPLPIAYNVFGGGTECNYVPVSGFMVSIDGSEVGVKYQLLKDGSPIIGEADGTGDTLHFGTQVLPGTYTVTAHWDPIVKPSACANAMAGSTVIIHNPLPTEYTVTGSRSYCEGSADTLPVGLSFSDLGIRYQLKYATCITCTVSDLGGPVDGTGSFFEFGSFTDTGVYTIVATDTITGCVTNFASSATIVQNPLPLVYTLSGTGQYCAGSTGIELFLTESQAGVNYQMFVGWVPEGAAVPGTGTPGPFSLGVQTTGGEYTVMAVTANGCMDTMASTATITVNPLPLVYNIFGGGDFCGADSTAYPVSLDSSEVGISYQLQKDGIDTLSPFIGTGSPFSFGPTYLPGVYTAYATNTITGCTSNMTGSATVTANLLPLVFTIAGGGAYCSGTGGVLVDLSGSEVGINYELYVDGTMTGSPVAGTGAAFDFGLQTTDGVYTVVARNPLTGCVNNMAGTAIVIEKHLPDIYAIAGGGPYCAGDTGVHIYLSASVAGIHYRLYEGTTWIDTLIGNGFGLDYGLYTTVGTYSILAYDTVSLCSANMTGTVSISINPLPLTYTVTGGGAFCAGGSGVVVALSGSSTSIEYQLYNGTTLVGTPVSGTGLPISFGLQTAAGTYSVVATNVYTTCDMTMTGTATITVNPVPAVYSVTGGGVYCANDSGMHIGMSGSETGVNYQLYKGGLPIGGPLTGTGSALDFGLFTLADVYSALAVNTVTGCASAMSSSATISINPLPTQYDVTGGGTYCAGDTVGLHVGLSNSATGISYQLYAGGTASGTPVSGTGSALDFGAKTTAGTYIVIATNTSTGCIDTMDGSAAITITPNVTPVVTLTATPGVVIGVGDLDTVVATVTGLGTYTATYQWKINHNIVPGATTNTLVFPVYFDNDSIECLVTSVGLCGGITTTKLIILHLEPVGVKHITNVVSDIRLIPNPNKGAFSLKGTLGTTGNEDVFVEVTNMLGQVVYRNTIATQNGNIDEQIQLYGNIANGMYLLNLRSGTSNTVFHFVVEQ